MMLRRTNNRKGFTLIELSIYIGVMGFVLIALIGFFLFLAEHRVKNQVVAEVEQQGAQVMQLMLQTIRNADAINAPAPATSATSTSIDVFDVVDDPTIFFLTGGTIQMTEAGGSAIDLTSSNVTASGLRFENVARTGTEDFLKVEFVLTHPEAGVSSVYNYQRTFYGSAAVREP